MDKELTWKNLQREPFSNLEDVRKILLSSEEDCVVFDMKRMTLEELGKVKLEDVAFYIDSEYFEEEYKSDVFENLKMFKTESIQVTKA